MSFQRQARRRHRQPAPTKRNGKLSAGARFSGRERRQIRSDMQTPVLGLVYHPSTTRLHAAIVRGPGPGTPLCELHGSLFQHPIFARDPNFGPGVPTDERHLYALWALRLNDGCSACQQQLIETGGDGIYPYLDPVKAE